MRRDVLLLVAVAATIAGVGAWLIGRAPSDELRPNPTAEWLDGKRFIATKVTGYDPIVGIELTLDLTSRDFTTNGGCNDTDGQYTLERGRLVYGHEVMQTAMACGSARGDTMAQDDWFSAVIDGGDIARRGDDIVVSNHGDTITFVPRVNPRGAAANTIGLWRLRSIRRGDGRRLSVVNGRRAVLHIAAYTGRYSSGCRSVALDLAHDGDAITIRRHHSDASRSDRCTKRAVPVDRAMADVLRGTVDASSGDGRRLTLRRAGTTLDFVRTRSWR